MYSTSIVITLAAALFGSAFGHSWIACTDYLQENGKNKHFTRSTNRLTFKFISLNIISSSFDVRQ